MGTPMGRGLGMINQIILSHFYSVSLTRALRVVSEEPLVLVLDWFTVFPLEVLWNRQALQLDVEVPAVPAFGTL